MVSAAATILTIETWPFGERFSFDHAEYEERTDRLLLTYGPVTAASAELTPEGHVIRIAAPDGYVCGLVLTGVRSRLSREGRVAVTLGPDQYAELTVTDLALLISHQRTRTGRFDRAQPDRSPLHG